MVDHSLVRSVRHLLGWCLVSSVLLTGCLSRSSDEGDGKPDEQTTTVDANSDPERASAVAIVESERSWDKYPDVPRIPIMNEIDGIPIPRIDGSDKSLSMTSEIPVDVGNEYAKSHPSQPVTGGRITVRLSSEPKTLNPIVETSAVQTYICQEYVTEPLARRDRQTLKRVPCLASEWIVEDSVKLAPDYPEHERLVSVDGQDPAGTLNVDYPEPTDPEKPPEWLLQTSGKDGNPLGRVWVGLFPQSDDMKGAPKMGYHFWSDGDGKLTVSGIVPGPYLLRTGDEIFGTAVDVDSGGLKVETRDGKTWELAAGQWGDVQRKTVFTYTLRNDAKWSDGTPFTTRDIEFAYAVLNNAFVDGESLRTYYADLVRCEAKDDRTILMQYRQQYFQAMDYTADITEAAPPWHVFEKFFADDGKTLTMERLTAEEEQAQNKVSVHGQVFGKFFNTDDRYNLAPLGTGPYVIEKWVRSDRLELRRNPNYWNNEGGGYLDRIIWAFIPDNVTALQALKSGEIDFLYRMDASQYFEALAGPPEWIKENYVKADWFIPNYGYVGWNTLNPLFQDRRVRVALALLFDVEEFVEKKIHDAAVPVSGSQYIFGPAYDQDVKPIGYSPETAMDLLAEAGWADTDDDGVLDKDDQKFAFTYLTVPGSPIAEARAALLQKSLKSAGITMNIQGYEWASFLDKILSKDFDVTSLSWVSDIESDPFQLWHGSQAGKGKRSSNHVSFNNPEADALIEAIRVTLDDEKRMLLNASLHRILDREQPYMFLYTPKEFGAYNKRYQGVRWYRLRPGFDLTEWYVPTDMQRN